MKTYIARLKQDREHIYIVALAEVLDRPRRVFFDCYLDELEDEIESKCSKAQSINVEAFYEVSKLDTVSKNPYLLQINASDFDIEVEEIDGEN